MVDNKPQDLTPEIEKQSLPFERVASHFIECVLDGVTCKAPLKHGLIVQQMMEAILKSAESGQPVKLKT